MAAKNPIKKSAIPSPKISVKYHCPYCDKTKKEEDFYVSSDPFILTGRTPICRECAEKIGRNWNPATQTFGECTKASLQEALERMDKPFYELLWEQSCNEAISTTHPGFMHNEWGCYMKNVSMIQHTGKRWRDGDILDCYRRIAAKEFAEGNNNKTIEEMQQRQDELREEYRTNRKDAIRMIGYDPFANYPVEDDKPVLYAQLINFIDEETKNDGMKMNAVIQIVKSFNQIQKINDAIDQLSSDVTQLNNNNGTIKQHAETISKLLSGANALAKDNGLSVNYNGSKSKGQDTLTGKMRELNLIGFRDAKINSYDIDYCRGMQQVAEISAKAQIDQIGFDENVIGEIQAIRRELVDQLQKERDKAQERARILLVENRDLKEFLRDKGLIDEYGQVVENE